MQETQGAWVLFLGQEMATCSSILAQKTPWTEEPGRIQFMGSQRVTTEQLHFHFTSRAIYLYLLYAYTLKLPIPGFAKPFLTCIVNFEELESNRN